MKHFKVTHAKLTIIIYLICGFVSAQTIQVKIIGGSVVTNGSTVTINVGNSLDFRITNTDTSNCNNLRIDGVDMSNISDFDINPNDPKKNIKEQSCNGNNKFLDFEVINISSGCATVSTLVTIKIKNQADFTFSLVVNSSPEIYVLGGSPYDDIYHSDTTTSDSNGTYFGVVDEGATITRRYVISNIGSCNLDITSLSSSNTDFVTSSPFTIPYNNIEPFDAIVFDVVFTAPFAGTGTQASTISIGNTDNTTFTFSVSAEMFNENIPGPGGITADFRLWLKSTRGITESASKISTWADLGTNGKDAIQNTPANQPTYLDTATDNINFNPVIKFENDGGSLEQYLFNTTNGFYSQDIFIVVLPDATITSASSGNTIFAGISSGSAGDLTGIGFGNYSSKFTNETLSYNQDVPSGGNYNGEAKINGSYNLPGIINVRNNAVSNPTGQDILYNSNVLATSSVNDNTFTNVGVAGAPILGTEYWIGRNFDVQGSLNGRVAEIFTFAERVNDTDRQKIESYLAIKYGISLGSSTEAEKDYINSFDAAVWDVSENTGYNYHVAGIGRDSISDLNQKQSKTINLQNEVSIGLGGLFTTNSANPNEFKKDGDFLVWGNNNAAFTGTSPNTITVAPGITTTLTRIDRKWKIVESNNQVDGDLGTVYISIPSSVFNSFSKTTTEEYALVVADNANFADGDIIDVLPLRSFDSGVSLQTWYNFDGIKYFTFAKVSNLSQNHSVSITSGDYLLGESDLNLNTDNFTISAWIKCASSANNRTIMAKGEKLQIRLNTTGNIEVYIEDDVTPKFTSNMDVDDGKWHHTAFVYDSGTVLMYIDGVLDKSVQDIIHPSPNFKNYCVGAVYIDKDNVIYPFLGEIDEVYVWDVELTRNQVRYLMNQEIERFDISGTDYVTGKILPQASASNLVSAIPWNNLRVYYDFNSFYGSTVEGLTNSRNFLRLKYLDKDKSLLGDQTTPLPYRSANSGDWDSATTWSNNADQIIPNSTSLNGTTIVDWNIVQISHDINSGDRDISVLGLIQTDGILTIADPVDNQDETNSGQALFVTNYLELDGVIDLVGESQLIQTQGSIIDADSGGYIERDQQGTANGFNYNYWSSSVGPILGNIATRGTGVSSTNISHTIFGFLNDGTISELYDDLNFNTSPYASDGTPPPPGFSKTISSNWLYKFYGPENEYDAWEKIDETSLLLPGEGFTMKGTSGAVTISTQQNYVFEGLPNNGDITLSLDKTLGEVDRLIGNPYPSAIDATTFILDNMSIADGGNNPNGTIFNGALYFWDHFGEENSHYLKEYVGGYATRNLTGGAVAISNDSRINNMSNSGSPANGLRTPGPYIPVNQGFFVSTALKGFENYNGTSISTVDGGDIVFKNNQRVYATEDGLTSLFLKSSSKKGENTNTISNNNTPTIKLMYNSPSGYHRQIVLGSNINASVGFDMGYDAFMADVNKEDMYWQLNNSKLVIQGINCFKTSQEFPIGIKVSKAGIASIRVDALENFDENLLLYIKDNRTGETYKINDNAFDVVLKPGEYKDRFSLVFKSKKNTLSKHEITKGYNNTLVYYNSETEKLTIVNKQNIYISNINLYNILGQEINIFKLNSSKDESVSLKVNSGTYIVKLHTKNGTLNKKIIIN